MRAAWPSTEFFGFGREGFELTPEQQAAAIERLRGATLKWSDDTGD
jgi:hypothetical protein